MATRTAILALDFDEVFILAPGTPTAKGAYTDRARTLVTVKTSSGLTSSGNVWYSPTMIEDLNVIVGDADKILLASSWGKASMKAVKAVGLRLPRPPAPEDRQPIPVSHAWGYRPAAQAPPCSRPHPRLPHRR